MTERSPSYGNAGPDSAGEAASLLPISCHLPEWIAGEPGSALREAYGRKRVSQNELNAAWDRYHVAIDLERGELEIKACYRVLAQAIELLSFDLQAYQLELSASHWPQRAQADPVEPHGRGDLTPAQQRASFLQGLTRRWGCALSSSPEVNRV